MVDAVANLRPETLDVLLYAGDGNSVDVHFRDKTTGDAVDVSDHAWSATWRPYRNAIDSLAIALDVNDDDAVTGDIVVTFSAATTRAILASSAKGVWDLQGTVGVADPQTVVTGNIETQEDVTR